MSDNPEAVFRFLDDLAICLQAQMEVDGVPDVCFAGVIPGDTPYADMAKVGNCGRKCGMAWVRLDSLYPAEAPGVQKAVPNNCSARIGFDVEIGILRCIKIPERGKPWPADLTHKSSDLQARDAMTMWRAVECCSSIDPQDRLLNIYSPMGPLGDLVGGSWSLMGVL